ncbi:transcriptional regulator with XRE-family HTH domain [Pseudarthrobacter defluvii]|uniref:helix-turn-helix domain-containing protein n=1 Tax=Pseudarthrobacter defluvii TaxID=410837 RepID=UPI002786688E|nr:helix-turn-helix transcriptional regulator [Pseudarthrobacter defluvii]MDQ0769444.1 transcriptional regulator with XRE-family HTH domain [Pseudarthrobacter defluvii]
MTTQPDNRADIRDFLSSRRAKLRPEQVGLPAGSRRRVPGLRREEVAILAGVSPEWYTRLEKGNIRGVSEDVLKAVAEALQLNEEEHTYLFELARAAQPLRRTTSRRKEAALAAPVRWLIESMSMSAAFVRNGRLDVIASNQLARSLHAPMFASDTTTAHGHANFARFHFLEPASREFFVDWEAGAAATAALLRAEAGRNPNDPPLRALIGELSTLSPEFRTLWASHDIRFRHEGIKRLRHPVVGDVELAYQSLALQTLPRPVHELSVYTAEPGTTHEERIKLLNSWTATALTEATGSAT